jgi:F-type H+-transporting ATPase subunit epsilon
MATMRVEVVSPERALFAGEATEVYARSMDGEIGILAGHQPALLLLDVAPLKVRADDGREHVFAVHSGFLEFSDNRLTVLADVAEPVGEIDVARAQAARQRAEEALRGDAEDAAVRTALARATLRTDLSGNLTRGGVLAGEPCGNNCLPRALSSSLDGDVNRA